MVKKEEASDSKGSGAFPRYRSIDRELKQSLMNLPDEYVMKVLE